MPAAEDVEGHRIYLGTRVGRERGRGWLVDMPANQIARRECTSRQGGGWVGEAEG